MSARTWTRAVLANTRAATTAAPAKRWSAPSSSSSTAAAKPRATYIRKPALAPAATAAPSSFVDASFTESEPEAATLSRARPVGRVPGAAAARAPVYDDEPNFDNMMEMDDMPLPEVPHSTPTSPAAASLDFPSVPFPLASEVSIDAAAVQPPVATAQVDWTTSFHGMSAQPFTQRAADLLMRPLVPDEIEIKPDGLLYLPEILYRRILNQAFGPGGWGMVPRGEMTVAKMAVSREWGLIAGGRLVSVARGEQQFFDASGLPTATEGCKSNALMRCCKDLGIASELWDPGFIRKFKAAHCVEAWTEHAATKKKQKRWRKKSIPFEYPLKEAAF